MPLNLHLDGLAWLIMYIHVSWSWRHLGILAHLFQVGFAVLAFYIGSFIHDGVQLVYPMFVF